MSSAKTRSELALEARALREGWQVSPKIAQEVISAAAEIAINDDKPRHRIAAARVILAASQLQLRTIEVEARTLSNDGQSEYQERLLNFLQGKPVRELSDQELDDYIEAKSATQ